MPKTSVYLLLLAVSCCVLATRFVATKSSSFVTAPDVAWAQPSDIAFHNLGPASNTERTYDCTPLEYRVIDDLSKTMRSGCFVPTSFGMVDPAQSVALLNGTDEAIPIKDGSRSAALSIVPHAGSVGRFGGFPGLGVYLYLYTDFYGALKDGGNPLVGRYKNIGESPNIVVSDTNGQPLAINSQALAYAAHGQWLVTEVPAHSLVRINLANFSIQPFAGSFFASGMPFANHRASMAVTEDGRYVAVASTEYHTFRIYDLKLCGATSGTDPLRPQNCPYYDYWSYVEQQVGRPVDDIAHLSFVRDDLLSMNIKTGAKTETYMLKPDGPITSLIPYLGLGDSYASGQGAFNYMRGTDTGINNCHLSGHSYPWLLNHDLFGGQGRSVACSGARIHDIGSKSSMYTGQNGDQVTTMAREADGSEVGILHDFIPGSLAQQRFVTTYQPGVVTVQIGGNDVGFSKILLRCLSPIASLKPPALNPNDCYQTYEDRLELVEGINRQYKNWVQLYRQLQSQSPGTRIYAVGYPQIISSNAECRRNVALTLAEITFARELTLYLNSVIQRAAKAAGVQYVDISEALKNRELCSGASGNLAVNGLTAGNDKYILGQESFHPNAVGHQLIEQTILEKTHNLSAPKPATEPVPAPIVEPSESVLQAPKTGRATTNVNNRDLTAGFAFRGSTVNIRLDGGDLGLKAGASYQVTVGGINSDTVSSDGSGTISGTVTIPNNTYPGTQDITVTGPGQGDEPITVVDVIYIPASPDDSDGDGTPNIGDSCPLAADNNICDSAPASAASAVAASPLAVQSKAAGATIHRVERLQAKSSRPTVTINAVGHTPTGHILGVKSTQSLVKTPRKTLRVFHWYWWVLGATVSYLVLVIIQSRKNEKIGRIRGKR